MMMTVNKYLPTPLAILAFLVSFLLIYMAGVPILQDYDMGWHIASGDLIRASGFIPEKTTYSNSGGEDMWYSHSWLWDIIISFIHEKSGVKGLYIFSVIFPSLVVATLIGALSKRHDIGVNAMIFTSLIAAYCLREFATGRPQIAGILLALIFYNILNSYRMRNDIRKLFVLPLLMMIWVNIHGSFIVGYTILGAFGLEAIFRKKWKCLISMLTVGIFCLFAALINPYGIDLIYFIINTRESVITQYITEWHPFVFGEVIGATFLMLAFVLFVDIRKNNSHLADIILAFIWLTAMFFSIRNVGFAAILCAPYLAANLPADDLKDKNTRSLLEWIRNKRLSPVMTSLTIISVIASYFTLTIMGKEHYLEQADKSPLPAIEYVMKNYPDKKLLNDYDFGGRIIYESGGKLPVFIDGRANAAYNEKLLSDFIDFFLLNEGWQEKMDSYGVEIILIKNGRDFAKYYERGLFHDEWQEVFRDDVASVYVRKDSTVKEIIKN